MRADSEKETVWLTQEEIALLFNTARSTITYHINKIFSSEELDKNTSVEKFDGRVNYRPAKLYNLDAIRRNELWITSEIIHQGSRFSQNR